MPIFSNQNGKLTMLNAVAFDKERALQQLVEQNLLETLDMYFIASEYHTGSGRIDTLAIDRDGAPTIIEFKRNKNVNVINQSLSYLKWIKAQRPEFFERLMFNRLGSELAESIRLDWNHPRIVCVAESYSRYDMDTVEVVPLRIDLFKYRLYEGGLFSLDMVSVNEQHKNRVESSQEMSADAAQTIIQGMKEQSGSSNTTRQMFDELREKILALDENIVEKPGRRTIAYRLAKNFCEILIKKDTLVIDLRPIDYQDPRGLVSKIYEGYVVTMNRRITLSDPRDLDYVFCIIQQSYKNVL